MLKKIAFGIGMASVVMLGTVQLATSAHARGPVDHCSRVLCAGCPDGYVLSPTKGNCCRCVPA